MTQASLPDDPRTHYVQSEKRVSLQELAALYAEESGQSLSSLKARCSRENWKAQRDEFWSKARQKVDQKAQEKIAEKKAKTITELNEAHDELIEHILTIGKGLLNGFIGYDPAIGAKRITCKPNEYRAAAQTLIELIRVQRLVHNFEPGKPVPQISSSSGSSLDALIEVLKVSAQEDWKDHSLDDQ
jgi:hypothetical protein